MTLERYWYFFPSCFVNGLICNWINLGFFYNQKRKWRFTSLFSFISQHSWIVELLQAHQGNNNIKFNREMIRSRYVSQWNLMVSLSHVVPLPQWQFHWSHHHPQLFTTSNKAMLHSFYCKRTVLLNCDYIHMDLWIGFIRTNPGIYGLTPESVNSEVCRRRHKEIQLEVALWLNFNRRKKFNNLKELYIVMQRNQFFSWALSPKLM